jgi:hypothetical protein
VAKHATVDEYIAAIPEPLREVAERTREVVDAELEGATSAIRWSHPTWSIGKAPVCYLRTASRHLTFGFWRGASIDDRSGRLDRRSVRPPRDLRGGDGAREAPRAQ